jgi:hypothetical protein
MAQGTQSSGLSRPTVATDEWDKCARAMILSCESVFFANDANESLRIAPFADWHY